MTLSAFQNIIHEAASYFHPEKLQCYRQHSFRCFLCNSQPFTTKVLLSLHLLLFVIPIKPASTHSPLNSNTRFLPRSLDNIRHVLDPFSLLFGGGTMRIFQGHRKVRRSATTIFFFAETIETSRRFGLSRNNFGD